MGIDRLSLYMTMLFSALIWAVSSIALAQDMAMVAGGESSHWEQTGHGAVFRPANDSGDDLNGLNVLNG